MTNKKKNVVSTQVIVLLHQLYFANRGSKNSVCDFEVNLPASFFWDGVVVGGTELVKMFEINSNTGRSVFSLVVKCE